jgi:hypothetical protein
VIAARSEPAPGSEYSCAPQRRAGADRRQEAAALALRAERDQRRAHHAVTDQPDPGRRVGAGVASWKIT